MRKLLNTLYVTTPESYLARDGENVVIRVENEVRFRIPVHNLEGIVCFGYSGASPALMGMCCERGVAISFLTEHGRFLGRVTGEVSGNVLLRRKQYRIADHADEKARLARRFVSAKIANSRSVLQRALRDHENEKNRDDLSMAVKWLAEKIPRLDRVCNTDEIRGIEGEASHLYFSCLDHLILTQKEDFFFYERSRRPPLDNMNALLSFLYTLLAHETAAALETVGLDPQVGFLHSDRPGRASLALDLMEEFRAFLADRLALSLVNRNQITAAGFRKKESGAVIMDDETRKIVLTAWQKRKQEEITHPFLDEKVLVGLLPYVQALLLARHLRGDLDDYPPFFLK